MIVPSRTTTAPIGTSFLRAASRARSSALRMYCSSSDNALDEPNVVDVGELSIGNRRLGCLSERQLALGIPINDDVISLGEFSLEYRQCQRILKQALDGPL